uniref:Ig-like domain-containing protein n=1 Tax=Catagonus wagneri TaxID=51154 RepID=A0A8C3VQK2_9CETA
MQLLATVLILWMQHIRSQVYGQQINQIPKFSLLQEGENFTTYCNSSRILNSFQWYKQRPGGSPVFLMLLTKPGEVKKPDRLTARFGDTRKDSSLHITAAQSADAGTYFCAETQCSGSTCCLSPNLAVAPGSAPPHFSSEQEPEKAEVTMSMKKSNF